MNKINITKDNYNLYENYLEDKKDINKRFRKSVLKIVCLAYIPVILTSGLALITLSKIMFGLGVSIIPLFATDVVAFLGWSGCSYNIFKKYEKDELSLIDKYNEIYIDKDWFVDDVEKMLEKSKSVIAEEAIKIYNENCEYYEEAKAQTLNHTEYKALNLNKKNLSVVSEEEIQKAKQKVKVLLREQKKTK